MKIEDMKMPSDLASSLGRAVRLQTYSDEYLDGNGSMSIETQTTGFMITKLTLYLCVICSIFDGIS